MEEPGCARAAHRFAMTVLYRQRYLRQPIPRTVVLMALFQQNVINTLLLYTANYTMLKCHREMAALSGNAQKHMLPYGGDSLHWDQSLCV